VRYSTPASPVTENQSALDGQTFFPRHSEYGRTQIHRGFVFGIMTQQAKAVAVSRIILPLTATLYQKPLMHPPFLFYFRRFLNGF
jgi:hypothetical protein